jgi:hypothetical protein
MKDDGVVFPDGVPVVGRFALPNGTAPLAQGVPAESDPVTLLAVKLSIESIFKKCLIKTKNWLTYLIPEEDPFEWRVILGQQRQSIL